MRYKSADSYYRGRFGKKMYRVSLDIGTTCPNRDGTRGTGGCIFCSAGGSGEFALSHDDIDNAIARVSRKAGEGAGYLAYFQSYTGTYCDVSYLKKCIDEVMAHPKIEGVIIATRPDSIPDDILELLASYNKEFPVFVELGLQTASDVTAEKINRCYKTEEFVAAVARLHEHNIHVTAHVIIGLPGESPDDMMDTVKLVVDTGCEGIKFTALYVLRGTVLADMYGRGEFEVLSMDEYFDIIDRALDLIPDGMTVFRLTGDGPKNLMIAPLWTNNKRAVINYINRRFG
jgi:hypothetical protein